jgi:hypothetical protein
MKDIFQHRCLVFFGVIILAVLHSTDASAEFELRITGKPGDATTVWQFSGSGVTTAAGSLVANSEFAWLNIGDYTDVELSLLAATLGTVDMSNVSTGQHTSFTRVSIDHDTSIHDDDIGFWVDGSLSWQRGQTLAWAGQLAYPVDIDSLDDSGLPFQTVASSHLLGHPTLILTISVPEPSSLAILGIAFMGLVAIANRRRL